MRNNAHSEMKIQTLNSMRTINDEPPRATAYYYADLERLKRKDPSAPENGHIPEIPQETVDATQNTNELSEYLEANEVVNDGAVREVPPLRDRQSSPEYSTPENRKEETYSTAGTFPMPEPKEKEPLLAELEVVGRLPLTQLETNSVRRSRSWYLCCPNMGEEEVSRESSWRYSSLRPVTAPPLPGQNGLSMVSTQSTSHPDDAAALRAERDALARALAAERQRAATAARAHDARLAELHGVIAELVRRRAQDKHASAIPEEEVSDECESTTQPAGELDNDEPSRTEQNDTSSLSPDTPAGQEKVELQELPDDTTETSDARVQSRGEEHALCVDTARCCQFARTARGGGSCDRERGSADGAGAGVLPASPGRSHVQRSQRRCESRQAKLASRVRLRTAAGDAGSSDLSDEAWCAEAAERLALDVCAQADLREALAAAGSDAAATLCVWAARCARLRADCRVLRAALHHATDTAHRLSCACAVQESSCVALCGALAAADRALEAYDVLLALAETRAHPRTAQRAAAELVGRRLLARLEAAPAAAVGAPLLSPGPWQHHHQHPPCPADGEWGEGCEARLRAHAARLKAETVALRARTAPPRLYSHYDTDEEDAPQSVDMAEMEAAVLMQEALAAREARLAARARGAPADPAPAQTEPTRARRKERHWLDARAAETDL